jgi:DNA-3-methyladenine glycosylase II
MEEVMQIAAEHLAKNDPVLAPVIARAGLCTIRPVSPDDYYWGLVDAIISQQLSVKAARAIEERFKALYPGSLPTPDQILITPDEKLREVGLSGAKVTYVKSLAQHIRDGKLELELLNKLSNMEVSRELTAVKGIGEWTAHMFLMFAMARLDILAVGDLGIRIGVQKLYDLDHLPFADEIHQIAAKNHWNPYETVACWYVWHAKDNY